MMIPSEKLRAWADQVDPDKAPHLAQFVDEVEAKSRAEVEAAKTCLRSYGFKVYEDQHHEKKEL